MLGRKEGGYEEALLEAARKSALNNTKDQHGRPRQPLYLTKIKRFLDVDFLRNGNSRFPDVDLTLLQQQQQRGGKRPAAKL